MKNLIIALTVLVSVAVPNLAWSNGSGMSGGGWKLNSVMDTAGSQSSSQAFVRFEHLSEQVVVFHLAYQSAEASEWTVTTFELTTEEFNALAPKFKSELIKASQQAGWVSLNLLTTHNSHSIRDL